MKIVVGNGQHIMALKLGKKKGTVKLPNGKMMDIVLHNVKYVPTLAPYNLFSITQDCKWLEYRKPRKRVIFEKGGCVLNFDVEIDRKLDGSLLED